MESNNMIAAASPEVDVEQLMTRIREEVARRKQQSGHSTEDPFSPPADQLPTSTALGLGELLRCESDEEFVVQAYRVLLQREPDHAGLQAYLANLEAGTITRINILRTMCDSEEGRKIGSEVPGLTTPFTLGELLTGNDSAFVTNAYRTLLGREPDTDGLQTYLTALDKGSLSRIDVLRVLRFSAEGQILGVKIAGLLPLVVEATPADMGFDLTFAAGKWPDDGWMKPNVNALIESDNLEINVDELMAHIRQEAAQLSQTSCTLGELLSGDDAAFVAGAYRILLGREPDEGGVQTYREQLAEGLLSRVDVLRALRFSAEGQALGVEVIGLPPPTAEPFPAITVKPEYQLGELLDYPDALFVQNAYRAILRREPDAEGLQTYLRRLQQGSLSKLDVLGGLRFSSEGREIGVTIHGLLAPWLLHVAYRIPLLGSLMALTSILLRPGKIIGRLRGLEARLEYEDWQRRDFNRFEVELNQLKMLADTKVSEIDATALSELGSQLVDDFRDYSTQLNGHINQLADGFRKYSTYTASRLGQAELELNQLKLLADAKANDSEIVKLQGDVSHLQQTKAGQAGFETLRSSLRKALQSKADTAEVDIAQLRLKQALETKVDQEALLELRQQLQILDERKAAKLELTSLTDTLTDSLQTRASTEDLIQIQEQVVAKADQSALTALQQALETKANSDTLTAIHQQLQETLQNKADQSVLATLQQTLETKIGAEQLGQELTEIRRQIVDHKHSIVDQQRRLALLLEEARKRLPEPLNVAQLAVLSDEADHVLDAMYVSFEDCFRGTREDIKQRLSVYLPSLPPGIGSNFAPAIDLGCGRGEWLELLKDHDLTAIGVDLNRVMVEFCRERELEVVEADAFAYLRKQPDNSLGLITGFHIIEHLPLRSLIALFDEALRVLKPRGMVIFETPNPENLVVGACNFYTDPTHHNPMPPLMTQFLIEARGFVRCEIRRMNQQMLNDPLRLLEPGTPGAAELNPLIQMAKEHYFAAPDYAVIAYKT